MNKGNYPSEELLSKYDFKGEYGGLVRACVNGDLAALEKELLENQDRFIQSGVFITVERLRLFALRNFVRRVVMAVQKEPALHYNGKSNQIDLHLLFRPLQAQWDSELDLDELEFLLANLLQHQMLKGYISHEHRILVLAQEPFPPLQ